MRKLVSVLFYCHFFFLSQCVGPTTPFGALNIFNFDKKRSPAQFTENSNYTIHFHPERQVYHDKTDLSFEIKGAVPIEKDVEIRVFHNEIDVTDAFLANAKTHQSADGKSQIFILNNVRLKILDPNFVRVQVRKGGVTIAEEELDHPDCSLFAKRTLATYGPFQVPDNYLTLIEAISATANTNPSFLAGIVAQESSFDPNAVSWAKAIGLTQMTTIAEEQVLTKVNDWPRYPGIGTLSYVTLKSKIYMGEIDDSKEWRLNPEQSLKGGMAYIEYLNEYWRAEQNKKVIDELEGDKEQVLSEIILASYNSGAGRVKNAVMTDKNNWKKNSNLKEAVRYLKKVSSYCFHYTKKESAKKEPPKGSDT